MCWEDCKQNNTVLEAIKYKLKVPRVFLGGLWETTIIIKTTDHRMELSYYDPYDRKGHSFGLRFPQPPLIWTQI